MVKAFRQTGPERGMGVLDARRRIVQANTPFARLLGKDRPSEVIGQALDRFLSKGIEKVLERASKRRAPVAINLRTAPRIGAGRKMPAFIAFHEINAGNPRRPSFVVIITPRSFGDQIGTKSYSQRLEIALDVGALGAWGMDLRTGEAWRTDRHDRIFGYAKTQPRWSYEMFIEHVVPEDRDRVNRTFEQAADTKSRWVFDCRIVRKDGEIRWISIEGGFEDDAQGEPKAMFGVVCDITDRKRAEEQIEFLAYYDSLTRLPNRRLLNDRLDHALLRARQNAHLGAVLFLDLDDFKSVNDTQGHQVGDEMLVEVAKRLRDCLRPGDTVARFGGDEFVIVLEEIGPNMDEAAASARQIAETVRTALLEPFDLSTAEQRYTSCSIGAVIYGDCESEPSTLLRQVDLAMYRAKAAGGDTVQAYAPEMQSAIDTRVVLEREIQQGIANDEFVLHYQPQLNLQDNTIKAEALLRWQHPQRGLLYPGAFIPTAEASALILPLGRRVLESACRRLGEWRHIEAMASISVAVNMSARQFHDPNFVADIKTAIARFDVDPRRLVIELTESVLLDSVDKARTIMAELSVLGVRFSLDDFGTGYSSLYYLKHLPLHQLKIDRRFVGEALSDTYDAAIVCTIITLAHAMGMEVVAEGVEREATRDFLISHECFQQQGFLFSHAISAERFTSYVRANPFEHALAAASTKS